MKRIMTIVVAMVMALSLVACGGSSGGGNKPSGNKPSGNKSSGNKPSGNKPSGNKPSNTKPSDLPNPIGTVSLDGKSLPQLELEECAVYIDDGEMIMQIRSEKIKLLKAGAGTVEFNLHTVAFEYVYRISLSNDSFDLCYLLQGKSEYQDFDDDKVPSFDYRLEDDTFTLAVNHSPLAAEEILAVEVFAEGRTASDDYVVDNTYYTRDKVYAEISDDIILPGQGNLYVTSLQEKAATSAKVDAYLNSGLPVPRDYGYSFFVDGDFVALQYKGALVQQLTEVGSQTDQLNFSVDFGGGSFYTDIVVTENGNNYTAEILQPGWSQQKQTTGKVYCMISNNVISIFPESWERQAIGYAKKRQPLEEVHVEIEPATTDKESISTSGGRNHRVENDVWLYVGMDPSSKVDAMQVLRADSEHGQYNVIATITNDQEMFIDRDVANMKYYYATRGVKGDKTAVFRSLREVGDSVRWYKGNGQYVRENVSSLRGDSFNGFTIFDSNGNLEQTVDGSIDETYKGEWDYCLTGHDNSGMTTYGSAVYVNINDSSLTYSSGSEYYDHTPGADHEPIVGGQSGSYSRCK